jgi:hypothetical protein
MIDILIEKPGGKQKITLDRKLFTIDPTYLDKDMCNIGAVLAECGQHEAEIKLEVARKEAAIEKLCADLDASVRIGAKGTGEKITEAQIKGVITANPQHWGALASLHESMKNANLMRWVMVALQRKADCLISISYRDSRLSRFER